LKQRPRNFDTRSDQEIKRKDRASLSLVIKKVSLVHATVPYSFIGLCSYANGCPTLNEAFRYAYKELLLLLLQMIIGCVLDGTLFGWISAL
jgi:hypothetical protein